MKVPNITGGIERLFQVDASAFDDPFITDPTPEERMDGKLRRADLHARTKFLYETPEERARRAQRYSDTQKLAAAAELTPGEKVSQVIGWFCFVLLLVFVVWPCVSGAWPHLGEAWGEIVRAGKGRS